MRYTKTAVVITAVLTLVGTSALAVTAATTTPMVHIGSTIQALVADLDQKVRQELATGCVERDAQGRATLCGASRQAVDGLHDRIAGLVAEERGRPAAEREDGKNAIRAFAGKKSLPLIYTSTVTNPYTDGGALIETYVDDQGNEYWINPANNMVVQVGAYENSRTAPLKRDTLSRQPVQELRKAALAIVEREVPGFKLKRQSFVPLEDNKEGQVYFFRWDDFSHPAKESEMPPFIQVGLSADGSLVSYTNTLKD